MSKDDVEAKRTAWARKAAEHLVDGLLAATERATGPRPTADQIALLREIALRALSHMPHSGSEARRLVRHFDIENLRHPDDEATEE